jgi:hypothetical protein
MQGVYHPRVVVRDHGILHPLVLGSSQMQVRIASMTVLNHR